MYHEDGAAAVPRGVQQPLEYRTLALPANQTLGRGPHQLGSMPSGSRTTGFRGRSAGFRGTIAANCLIIDALHTELCLASAS